MKHLVMLGAGHAHVHMLSTLASQGLAGVQVTLVAPHPRQLYSGMIPGYVAGHYLLDDCVIPLEPLLANSGVQWLQRSAVALDAQTRELTLDDGSTIRYDVLSVNSGPVQDRQKIEHLMPGAREHALFVRPIEAFGALWPQVVMLAQSRPLRVAVIGGGAAGIELACAVAYRFKTASVTLLSGVTPVAANYPAKVQARVINALKDRNITVIQESVSAMAAGEVTLGSGARLTCDVPILATGAQAPAWLQESGLALDGQGFMAVDACQRSTSHPQVFAAGDVCTRMDRPHARSGVYAVRAGAPLAHNLRAVLAGIEPSRYQPQDKTLNLLSCGNRYAIASWGNWSAQGHWVWWLKNWIDRGFIKKYRPAAKP
ncbi:FAD-dependent oxidoreductase [Rhodoferax sp.]|uniref:FAD-dependent oxidoreductase n=1 Tax=Rhodoferax sp. TaxID=50421 RepID=UPI0026036162|nr:FAD-dependent oxidoreductase [Rhodoferax sp.]MDD2924209.1 FAD-dependent oxidoreductase [Rhodoferax sp.]